MVQQVEQEKILQKYLETYPDDLPLIATIMAYVGLRATVNVLQEAKGRRIRIVESRGHSGQLQMRYVEQT